MLKVRYSSKFKKDFKAIVKRGYDILTLTLTRTGSHSDLF